MPEAAVLAREQGKHATAARLLADAADRCDQGHHDDDRCFDLWFELSIENRDAGDVVAGERAVRRALAIAERTLRPSDPAILDALAQLGSTLDAQGHYADATPYFQRALHALDTMRMPDESALDDLLSRLVANLTVQGEMLAAEPLLRRMVTRARTAAQTVLALNELALNLDFQDRTSEAEQVFRRALPTAVALPDRGDAASHVFSNLAGNLVVQRKRIPEAIDLLKRAIAIEQWAHRSQLPTQAILAAAYNENGDFGEAERIYRVLLASDVTEKVGLVDDDLLLNGLAVNLIRQGRAGEARPYLERAVSLTRGIPAGHPSRIIAELTLGDYLIRHTDDVRGGLVTLRQADADMAIRARTYPAANSAAIKEIRKFSAIYVSEVRAAWLLSRLTTR